MYVSDILCRHGYPPEQLPYQVSFLTCCYLNTQCTQQEYIMIIIHTYICIELSKNLCLQSALMHFAYTNVITS